MADEQAFITGPNGNGMTSLGAFGATESVATEINNAGQVVGWTDIERAGTGNLNKPLSGESATFDCLTGRENGAEDGKKNEADALGGIQSQGGAGGDSG